MPASHITVFKISKRRMLNEELSNDGLKYSPESSIKMSLELWSTYITLWSALNCFEVLIYFVSWLTEKELQPPSKITSSPEFQDLINDIIFTNIFFRLIDKISIW